jgi:hypothetical protein
MHPVTDAMKGSPRVKRRERRMKRIILLAGACSMLALSGCGSDDDDAEPSREGADGSSLPQGSEPVNLDPADFTTRIDNPYWPMAPESRWVYRETAGGSVERAEVTVTKDTRKVDGITSRVIYDVVTKDGKLVERTYDWYAQDSAGNLWYLGEDTKEYENGEVSTTSGSWEAGVDGAEAGVIMPGKPRVGLAYRQEYYAGEAEDRGRILSLDEKVRVPFGRFDNVLMTEDTAPLAPRLVEHKYYARGVGPVLSVAASGGSERSELVSFTKGR